MKGKILYASSKPGSQISYLNTKIITRDHLYSEFYIPILDFMNGWIHTISSKLAMNYTGEINKTESRMSITIYEALITTDRSRIIDRSLNTFRRDIRSDKGNTNVRRKEINKHKRNRRMIQSSTATNPALFAGFDLEIVGSHHNIFWRANMAARGFCLSCQMERFKSYRGTNALQIYSKIV